MKIEPSVSRRAESRTLRWLSVVSTSIALGMLVLGTLIVIESRNDIWAQAESAAGNVALALDRDIGRNISVFDLSLQGVADGLRLAGIDEVGPEIRQMALFDRAATAEYLGSIVVTDAAGSLIESSLSRTPPPINIADVDYFRIHRQHPDAGLFISRPYRSRTRGGDLSVAISRRLSGPDGRFLGVVAGSLRQAYFQDLMRKLDLGPHGSVVLLRTDGSLIARSPFREDDIDRDVSATEGFRIAAASPSGTFVVTATIDGIKRLYTFRHVGNLPLIVTVGVAVDDIYAAWWPKALGLGAILALLCAATVGLCLLFRREMLRRMAVESALLESSRQMAVMATTDGLTGLANRRSFDETLHREWADAVRSKTCVSLLMLDADCFKLYNDFYGHPEGDEVLRRIAACIRESVRRPRDHCARYGGEEFAVILPGTDEKGALQVAEQIRRIVIDLAIPHIASAKEVATISVGVATLRPQPGDLQERLVAAGDAALYEAKRAGRNCVMMADRKALLRLVSTAV